MIFRQLFDSVSGTYSYLLASRRGGEALIIDPVLEKVDRYLQLVSELDLKLVKAVDTHLHADHITGLGALRDRTQCITVMGEQSERRRRLDAACRRRQAHDRGRGARRALHARPHRRFLQLPDARPGVHRRHAADPRHRPHRFPERRSARAIRVRCSASCSSCRTRRWSIPAHDYKGDTVSTIGEEKAFNPRLQVKSVDEYVALMNSLNLPNPKMMDVAVPANMRVGLVQDEIARRGWAMTARRRHGARRPAGVALIDLREHGERAKHGMIPGSLHAPYPELPPTCGRAACCTRSPRRPDKRIVFYCAFGERSAMAVQAAQDAGLKSACHIQGGLDAWKKAQRAAREVRLRFGHAHASARIACGEPASFAIYLNAPRAAGPSRMKPRRRHDTAPA